MDDKPRGVGTRFGISTGDATDFDAHEHGPEYEATSSYEQDPRADPAHPEHGAWLRETEEMIARQRDAKRA
jgi:hypothetical protein